VAAAPLSAAGQETGLARWEHLREVLLLRLSARGILGFAWFRKTLVANRSVIIADKQLFKLVQSNSEDEGPAIIPIKEVASVFLLTCCIQLGERDLDLIAEAFAIDNHLPDGSDRFIDADLFADALRGEPSPGRRRYLNRLYSRLQRAEGALANSSLTVAWIEERLCHEIQPEVPNKPGLDHLSNDHVRAHDVLATLPLVRAHVGVPCFAFVRWMLDITFREPDHGAFSARVHRMWGACAGMADEREERSWNLRLTGVVRVMECSAIMA
jgi:hypothetical protein